MTITCFVLGMVLTGSKNIVFFHFYKYSKYIYLISYNCILFYKFSIQYIFGSTLFDSPVAYVHFIYLPYNCVITR